MFPVNMLVKPSQELIFNSYKTVGGWRTYIYTLSGGSTTLRYINNAASNNYSSHHNEVMLSRHSDKHLPNSSMQVNLDLNHFHDNLASACPGVTVATFASSTTTSRSGRCTPLAVAVVPSSIAKVTIT